MKTKETFSLAEARRIALEAQGFANRLPAKVDAGAMMRLIRRIGVVQIDSVNVLVRTHYLPLLARLGPYDMDLLRQAAWGNRQRLFESWAHEASLVPVEQEPLLRWRGEQARTGEGIWKGLADYIRGHPTEIDAVYNEVVARGPVVASQLNTDNKGGGTPWWGWSNAKRELTCLFLTGRVAVSTRLNSFERVYDIPERVLPKAVFDAPTPSTADAQRELMRIAAKAMGIATERDLRDYFRLTAGQARPRIRELVDAGELTPVKVKGWTDTAYLSQGAKLPRRVERDALLSPFDNLIWFRDRTERMFGLRYRIEIYTPPAKRIDGYYVLPFLQGEAITARFDLKSDRKNSALLVLASYSQPEVNEATAAAAARSLREMAAWLGLERVAVTPRGDLAEAVEASLPLTV